MRWHVPWRNYTTDNASSRDEWILLQDYLGSELTYRPSWSRGKEHGYIEPAYEMLLTQYEEALAATRQYWRVYSVKLEERP
jgi:hypothetical protein